MTGRTSFDRPRGVLTLWSILLAAGVGLIAVADVGILRYARDRLARDYRYHVNEASRFIENRKFAEARERLEEAFRLAPDAPSPYVATGHLHYAMQNWAEAAKAYSKAIELETPDRGVWLNLVWCYVELGLYDKADALGRSAIKLGVDDPALYRYLAEARWRAGDYKDAAPYLSKSLEHYSGDLYLMHQLRQAYERTGETARAEEIERRIEEAQAGLNTLPRRAQP